MGFFRKTFRIWWQKPRKLEDAEEDRRVSPLELFYDLAFVGIIYQITHTLITHIDIEHILEYILLYGMIFSAWVNGTLYHELHGNNDIRTRVFMFLQIFALTFIGIFAPTAFGDGANGFALSYAIFMSIITWLWISTGISDPAHRPLSIPYSIGHFLVILCFVASLFFDPPMKYFFWYIGTMLTFLVPVFSRRFTGSVDPKYREMVMHIRPSLVERFWLLTIIVLGEAIASIMRSTSHHTIISYEIILFVFLSLGIITSMWWSYFDLVANRIPLQKNSARTAWMYLHFPLTLSIGLTAGGLYYLLEYPENISLLTHWLILGSIIMFLLSLKILIYTLQVTHIENQIVYKRAGELAFFAAIAIFIIGFFPLSIIWTLFLSILLMLFPVFGAIRFWITYRLSLQEDT